MDEIGQRVWTGIKSFGRSRRSVPRVSSLLTFGWTDPKAGSCRKDFEERAEEKGAEGHTERCGEEERVKEKVEAMVLGDLMRRGGRRGFPKQLAAISTDPIKINERAACESKPLRRPVCRSHSLFLFPLPFPFPSPPFFSFLSLSLFLSFPLVPFLQR